MPRIITILILALLSLALGIAFFRLVRPFVMPLLLAVVVAILLQPLNGYFLAKCRGRRHLAAGLTTVSILLLVFVPLLTATFMGAAQLFKWAAENMADPHWHERLARLRDALEIDHVVTLLQPFWIEKLDAEQLQGELTSGMRTMATGIAQQTYGAAATGVGLLGATIGAIISTGMFLMGLFFFLADGPALLDEADKLLPLQAAYKKRILGRFVSVTRAVVLGTFAAAIAQGLATGLGLSVAGYGKFAVILTLLATISALVPVAGTWLVWVPCAIWLGVSDWNAHWLTVTILCLYNILFVGTLDNVIRVYILNSDVQLHPLLAFVSVFGGLQWLGLWGAFIGPVVASCLHALVTILNEELTQYALEQQQANAAANAAAGVSPAVVPPPATPAVPTPPAAVAVSPNPPQNPTPPTNKKRAGRRK